MHNKTLDPIFSFIIDTEEEGIFCRWKIPFSFEEGVIDPDGEICAFTYPGDEIRIGSHGFKPGFIGGYLYPYLAFKKANISSEVRLFTVYPAD